MGTGSVDDTYGSGNSLLPTVPVPFFRPSSMAR